MAKRPVFQEVTEDIAARPVATTGIIDAASKGARGAIRAWLIALFIMVAAMIALGGVTRLTGSGGGLTEWVPPVTGIIPPSSDAAWQAEFDAYQASSQASQLPPQIDLAGFKRIYWWEWAHRLLGGVIGLAWIAGFAFFWASKRMPTGWAPRLLGLGGLVGLQGAIGWWMAQSGLQEGMARLASYRLATHFGLAFAILGLIAWCVAQLSRSEAALLKARRAGEPKLFSLSTGLMHFAFVQILLGALVAGLDAGRQYPGWPTMGGAWVPAAIWDANLGWRNIFENPALVQFIHRMAGYLLVIFAVLVWRRARRSPHPVTRGAFTVMLVVMAAQIGLGILTVLHAAPLALALIHQLGAVALFVLIIRARHHARYPVETSLRGA